MNENTSDTRYYAMIGGHQQGPYSLMELVEAGVLPDTYIWCKGMKRWAKARYNADVCRHFRQSLSDAMHPVAEATPEEGAGDTPESTGLPRFQFMIERSGEKPEWLESTPPDMSVPPRYFIWESVLATLLCFPITGIAAVIFGIMSRKAWKEGHAPESYEFSRRARMTLGMTLFFGLVVWAVATL